MHLPYSALPYDIDGLPACTILWIWQIFPSRLYIVNQNEDICLFHLYLKAEKAQQREKNLEEAKKITIKEDESLPKAKRVSIWYKKSTR